MREQVVDLTDHEVDFGTVSHRGALAEVLLKRGAEILTLLVKHRAQLLQPIDAPGQWLRTTSAESVAQTRHLCGNGVLDVVRHSASSIRSFRQDAAQYAVQIADAPPATRTQSPSTSLPSKARTPHRRPCMGKNHVRGHFS
ncbi:hypothetical protein GCM10009765_43640 [Fodinicola feengrottensis]|uniref:Uncharacterized protein n=1 Tax=Fodinicola feengrottensis TaxID=435914 RepID=A0ABN2HLV3_9ACTN|nr:hypothetical protein [Fodinicola feengrottensis]